MYPKKSKGFTLLEILVAVFILSIITAMLASALKTVLTTKKSLDSATHVLHQTQLSLFQIEHTIHQTVNKKIIQNGIELPPVVGDEHSLTITQLANKDTISTVNNNLIRINFKFENGILYRSIEHDPNKDARAILDSISEFEFSYLHKNGKFSKHWPDATNIKETMPYAIQLEIVFSNGKKLTQLFVFPEEEFALSIA